MPNNNVDTRVVQMEFDNAAFEKKVAQSRKTISNLKKDLIFDENVDNLKTLNKAMNSFDTSSMAANIEKISDRFSTMGIVGATIIQDLTKSVLNFGKKVANSTIGQMITGGRNRATNLEQAKFQIAGLSDGQDWEQLGLDLGKSLYNQINDAVSGTAYGLDAAAKVAGQLLASNIEAGTQDMQDALSGISGVAAMTNSTYEEIGHIFTTIAGNGRVMAEQLNQFASRGLNVAAELAKAYGTDESTLRSMVSKGQVDFKTFAKAMNNAFGKQATKANETYTGALSNVNAALSRLGEGFQTPYRDNMRKFFVELIPVLNAVKKTIGPVYTIAEQGMEHLSNVAIKLLRTLAFQDENGLQLTGLQTIADWISKISTMFEEFGHDGYSSMGNIKRSIKNLIDMLFSLGNLVKIVLVPIFEGFSSSAFKGMNPVLKVTSTIAKMLTRLSDYIKDVVSLIDSTLNKNKALSRVIQGLVVSLKPPIAILGILIKIIGALIKVSIRAVGIIFQILAPLGDLIVKIHEIFIESGLLRRIFSPLVSAFQTFGRTISKLANAFRIFFTGALKPLRLELKGTSDIWDNFADSIGSALTKAVNFVSKYLGKLSDFLISHQTTIQKAASYIGNAFVYIVEGIKTGWNKAKEFVTSFSGANDFFSNVSDKFIAFRDSIASTIESFKEIKTDGISTFTEHVQQSTGPLQAIARFLVIAWETIKSVASKVAPLIKATVTAIFDGMSSLLSIFKSGIDTLNPASGLSVLTSGGIVAGLSIVLVQVKKILTSVEKIQQNSPFERLLKFVDSLTGYMSQLSKTKASEALKNFATSLLEIAAAVLLLSMIEPKKMFGALMAVSLLIWELVQAFKAMDAGSIKVSAASSLTSSALIKMASSLLVLAIAIKTFANMDAKKLLFASAVVSGLLWELVGIMRALSESSDNAKRVIKGAASLIAMALAVKILAKSVAVLAEIDSGRLIASAFSISVITVALKNLAESMSKNNKGILKAGAALITMSFAIGKLAGVVKSLTELNPLAMTLSTAAIIALVMALKSLVKLKHDEMDKLSKTIKSVSIGMVMLALSFKIFESVDPEAMKKAGIALGAILLSMTATLGILTAFDRLSKNGKGYADSLVGLGVALAGLGVAVAGLASAAKLLNEVDWTALGKAGAVMGGALAALTAIVLLSKIKMDYNNMKAMSLALVAMSGSLVVFGAAMLVFTAIPIFGIVKGLSTLTIALGLLIGATYALKRGNIDALLGLAGAMALTGAAMVAFSAGLLALAAAIPPLAASVGMVEIILGGLLIAIVKLASLIARAVGVVIAAIVAGIVASLPILKNAVISVFTNVLDTLNDLIPKIGDTIDVLFETVFPLIREWLPKLLGFLVKFIPELTDALVLILIATIEKLADRTPDLVAAIGKFFKNLLGAIKEVAGVEINEESMRSLLIGLGIFAAILVVIAAAANIAQKAIGGVIALMLLVGLIGLLFVVLTSLDTESFINVATGVSEAFLAISGAMLIISMVPIAGAIKGALGLMVVVAALTAVLVALGELTKIDGFKEVMENGVEIFGLIGTAIGTFVGNLVGSLLGGISEGLPQIAANLSAFMVNLMPFIMGAQLLNQSLLDGVLILCGVILAFTGASLLSGIAGFFGAKVDYAEFGRQLVAFAPFMGDFANAVKGVNVNAVKNAAEAAKALADFASAIPNSGGLLGQIMGENDIDDFGTKLRAFASGLVGFNNTITDGKNQSKLNTGAIKDAAEAGAALANMAQDIPNSGGFLGQIMGENDIDTFGSKLTAFAEGLVGFNNAITDEGNNSILNKEAIEDAAEATGAIVDVARDIPNEGGMLAGLVGDNSLAMFGPELESLGTNLANFSAAVSGRIDNDSVTSAVELTKSIVEIAKDIPNEGESFVSLFVGDNSLGKFSEHLVTLGKNIALMSQEIRTVNLYRVKEAIDGFLAIANIAIALQNFDKNNLKNFADGMTDLGKADVDAFLSAFENARTECISAAETFLDLLATAIEDEKDKITRQADISVTTFIDGINQNEYKIANTFRTVMTDSISTFSEFNDDLFWIGANFVLGIANGIYMNEFAVINAAISVANSAINTTHEALDENSPSRIGFDAGKFWDLGIAGGMTSFAYTVSEASEHVSNEVLEYVDSIKSAVDEIDFEDVDPTIRPVMDLSNVNVGLRAIGDMMKDSNTYSIGVAVARDRAEYSKRTNTLKVETDNKDVIDAINDLRYEMSDMKEKMSRMGVYLNGKAMVGELVDPMDKALGSKVNRNNLGGVKVGRLV